MAANTLRFDLLQEAVRKAAPAPVWTHGVELSRGQAVVAERLLASELVLRVKVPGRASALAVRFYPDDDEWEWECECPSKLKACEHVAAAALSLRQAQERGESLPSAAKVGGHVVYAFAREAPGLALERYIVDEHGQRSKVTQSLIALLGKRSAASKPLATPADIAADQVLTTIRRGALPIDELKTLVKVLFGAAHVELDGKPVEVDNALILPMAVIDDHPEGFRLTLRRDPAVSEVVCPGLALCGQTLRPIGSPHLGGQSLERLPLARLYRHEHLAKLMDEVIPGLRKHARLAIKTDKLPKLNRHLVPELLLAIERRFDTFEVLATIVYGDPPVARVQGTQLHAVGGNVLPTRDEAAERQLELRLREVFDLMINRRATLHGPAADTFVARLLKWTGRVQGYDPRAAPSATLQPRWLGNDKQAALDFTAGDHEQARAHSQDVLRAFQQGLDQVRLLDGSYAALPKAWLAAHAHQVEAILAAKNGDEAARYAHGEVAALCQELKVPPPLAARDFGPLLLDFTGLPSAKLPNPWQLELRDYQRVGVNWLSFLRTHGFGGLLADDMGLGKTAQALAVLQGRNLVVAPTSVVPAWLAQARLCRPGMRVCNYTGPKRQLDNQAELVITSYALLRQDLAQLQVVDWDGVVLDEAQHIKNADSQTARAAFALPGKFRLALSGTPVENHLEELWSVLRFSNPGLLPERSRFATELAAPITQGDPQALQRLRDKIRPFVLRRRKQEVARELPARSEMVLYCELQGEERGVYDALLHQATREVQSPESSDRPVMQVLETLLRLRQACCHLGLLPGQHAATSAKTEALCHALRTCIDEGHRALVFSQWTSFLDLIAGRLAQEGMSTARLDGSTTNREEVVARFQAVDGPDVMLLSLKAGGTGLTLTAADHVFIVDPWWNPAAEAQAADRAHRIGQDKPVFIYRLVARDTVEEKMLDLQANKLKVASAALEGAAAAALTREDLLGLLASD